MVVFRLINMKNSPIIIVVFLSILPFTVSSQIQITIDAASQPKPVSKYLYGRNNSLSDDPTKPLNAAAWTRLRDAGVTFLRESGGRA